MAPRTILYTGKGGVGKTSVAAATARRVAASGIDTVVLSTDPAHSLADSLQTAVGGEPTQVGERLWAQQVSAQDEMERNWAAVQDWLGELLLERGVDRISAEELTVPPGLDELFSLLQIKRHHEDGRFGCVIVDCAPTGETLRLLSFPDVARWWLEKVFPQSPQLMAAARPLARAMLDVSLPGDAVLDDVQRLVRNLIAMNEILRDTEHVSVRLVMTPDRMVVDEARRTFTYLNLYGYLTDAVVVNRVFPEEVGPYFGAWRERQLAALDEVQSAFAPGAGAARAVLRRGGRRRGHARPPRRRTSSTERDPGAVLHEASRRSSWSAPTRRELRMDLPFAEKGDDLAEEDRPRARRARRRLQAHADAAARDGRLPSHRRLVRRRRPARDLRWPRLTRSPSCASASTPRRPPPSAWPARPATTPPSCPAHAARDELDALVALLRALRELVPPELQQQVSEVIRQVLLLLRAVIDYWVDRLDAPRPRGGRGRRTSRSPEPVTPSSHGSSGLRGRRR